MNHSHYWQMTTDDGAGDAQDWREQISVRKKVGCVWSSRSELKILTSTSNWLVILNASLADEPCGGSAESGATLNLAWRLRTPSRNFHHRRRTDGKLELALINRLRCYWRNQSIPDHCLGFAVFMWYSCWGILWHFQHQGLLTWRNCRFSRLHTAEVGVWDTQ